MSAKFSFSRLITNTCVIFGVGRSRSSAWSARSSRRSRSSAWPCSSPTTSTRPRPGASAGTRMSEASTAAGQHAVSLAHGGSAAGDGDRRRRRRVRRCRACRARPGPAALGRGVIVESGAPVPEPWADAPAGRRRRRGVGRPGRDGRSSCTRCGPTRTPVVIDLRVAREELERARDRRPARVRAHARVRLPARALLLPRAREQLRRA